MAMLKVGAGRLKSRVKWNQCFQVVDPVHDNETTPQYKFQRMFWAEVMPLRGESLVRAQQIDSKITYRVIVRNEAAIGQFDTFTDGDRTLYVQTKPYRADDVNAYLVCDCGESAPSGQPTS